MGDINKEVKEWESDEPIHKWFGLSYSNYLVLPRSILQSMPIEWQRNFVNMIEEIEDRMNSNSLIQQPDYRVRAINSKGQYIKDVYSNYWRLGRRVCGLVDVFNDKDDDRKCYGYKEKGDNA